MPWVNQSEEEARRIQQQAEIKAREKIEREQAQAHEKRIRQQALDAKGNKGGQFIMGLDTLAAEARVPNGTAETKLGNLTNAAYQSGDGAGRRPSSGYMDIEPKVDSEEEDGFGFPPSTDQGGYLDFDEQLTLATGKECVEVQASGSRKPSIEKQQRPIDRRASNTAVQARTASAAAPVPNRQELTDAQKADMYSVSEKNQTEKPKKKLSTKGGVKQAWGSDKSQEGQPKAERTYMSGSGSSAGQLYAMESEQGPEQFYTVDEDPNAPQSGEGVFRIGLEGALVNKNRVIHREVGGTLYKKQQAEKAKAEKQAEKERKKAAKQGVKAKKTAAVAPANRGVEGFPGTSVGRQNSAAMLAAMKTEGLGGVADHDYATMPANAGQPPPPPARSGSRASAALASEIGVNAVPGGDGYLDPVQAQALVAQQNAGASKANTYEYNGVDAGESGEYESVAQGGPPSPDANHYDLGNVDEESNTSVAHYDLGNVGAGAPAHRRRESQGQGERVIVVNAADGVNAVAADARRARQAAELKSYEAGKEALALQRQLANERARKTEAEQALINKMREQDDRPFHKRRIFFVMLGVIAVVLAAGAAAAAVLATQASDTPDNTGNSTSGGSTEPCEPFGVTILQSALQTVTEGTSALSLEDMFSLDFSKVTGDFFLRLVLPLAAGALSIARGAEEFRPGANGVVDLPIKGNGTGTLKGLELRRESGADTDGKALDIRVAPGVNCGADGEKLGSNETKFSLKITPTVSTPSVSSKLSQAGTLSRDEGQLFNLEDVFKVSAPFESDETQTMRLGFPEGTQFIKSGKLLGTVGSSGTVIIEGGTKSVKVQLPREYGDTEITIRATREDGPVSATSATLRRQLSVAPVADVPVLEALTQTTPISESTSAQRILLTDLIKATIGSGQDATYELKGAPIGSTLLDAAGKKIANFNSPDVVVPFSRSLDGVELELPAHQDTTFSVSLRGHTKRGGKVSDWSAFTEVTVPMVPVSNGMTVTTKATALVAERGTLDISGLIESTQLVDASETARFELSGIPDGVKLTQDGTPLTAQEGKYLVDTKNNIKAEIPEGANGFTVGVRGRTIDKNAEGKEATPSDWSAKAETVVTVSEVAKGATVEVVKATVDLSEGNAIVLADLFDVTTTGGETLIRHYSGLPKDAQIKRDGTVVATVPASGEITLEGTATEQVILADPHHKSDVTVGLQAQTKTAEGAASPLSDKVAVKVSYTPVAEGVAIQIVKATHTMPEDGMLPISDLFTVAAINDVTEVPTYEIAGLPKGTIVSRNAAPVGTAGDAGTVSFTGAFENVTGKLPEHYKGKVNLSLRGKTKDGVVESDYSVPKEVEVTISPVSDGADLSVSSSVIEGTMEEAVSLKGKVAFTKKDAGELALMQFTGLPSGAVMTDGVLGYTAPADGSKTGFKDWDLDNLKLTVQEKGALSIGVEVKTQDGAAVAKTSSDTLKFTIKSNSAGLEVTPTPVTGKEDEVADLGDLGIVYTGDGGIDSLKIELKMKDDTDLPAGLEIKDKNGLVYKPGNAGNPKLLQLFVSAGAPWSMTPPPDFHGDLDLQVVVTAAESTVTADLPVKLTPVVDKANLSAGEMTGKTWVGNSDLTSSGEKRDAPLLDFSGVANSDDIIFKEQVCGVSRNNQREGYLFGGSVTNVGGGCYESSAGGFGKDKNVRYANAPERDSTLRYTVWTRGPKGDETMVEIDAAVKTDRWCETDNIYQCPS